MAPSSPQTRPRAKAKLSCSMRQALATRLRIRSPDASCSRQLRSRLFQASRYCSMATRSRHRTFFTGLTPGFAGLYQINLRLPDSLSPNPVIQIVMGSDSSPATVQLPTR